MFALSKAAAATSMLAFALSQNAWSEGSGVYSPLNRWTKDKTVASESASDPLTITACWEQGETWSYYDDDSGLKLRVAEFNLKPMMDKAETAIRTGWEWYSNLKVNWKRQTKGVGCDVTIRIDPEMNNKDGNEHALGYYEGLGTNTGTGLVRVNLLFLEPTRIYQHSDPNIIYPDFFIPGKARGTYQKITESATTPAARQELGIKIAAYVLTHEFGHVLGIHHEQCYKPGAWDGNTAGCGAGDDVDLNIVNIGQYDMYSTMLYNGYKHRQWDYTLSCGDIMTVRGLYGKKEQPFDRKNICYVGGDVCRDKPLPALPKSSADPIPTTTPGGSCDLPAIDDAVFQSLSSEQKSSATLTTSTLQNVPITTTFDEFKPNPAVPQIPAGADCADVTWSSPDQTSSTLSRVFVGEKVHVKVTFPGRDGVKYTLYATGAGLGQTVKPPRIPIKTLQPNANGTATIEMDFFTPFKIQDNNSQTAENNYFLGFQLESYFRTSGGPLPPLDQYNFCHTPKVTWVSERVKKTITTMVQQRVDVTETARFAILNGFSVDAGPAWPTAMAGSIYPLEWAQSKQVASATFELLLYPDKATAKESPSATYRIGTWSKAEGSHAQFITFPKEFTNAAGQIVKVKGWVRFKGVANVNTTSAGTMTAHSLPFYLDPPTPTLSTFSPSSGNPGDEIILSGRFDGASTLPATLTYRGNAIPILEKSDTQIKFKVPDVRASGAVQLTVDGVESNRLHFQINPRIESISPEHPVAGQITTITGYGFKFDEQNTVVALGTQPTTLYGLSDELIQFTFYPSCLYGPGPLTVTVGAASHSKTVTPTPVLGSLMGDAGVPGQSVTMAGEGFAAWSKVSLNGNLITPSSVANSAITFTIPEGSVSGPIKVVIPANGDQTQVESNSFHFTVGAKATSISKDYGIPGEFITLTGSFGNSNSTRTVMIGPTLCPILSSSSTSIQFSVPVGFNTPSGLLTIAVDQTPAVVYCPFTIVPLITNMPGPTALPGEELRLSGYFHGTELIIRSAGATLSVLGKGVDGGKDYLTFAILNDFSATGISVEMQKIQAGGVVPMGSFTVYPRPRLDDLSPVFGSPDEQIVLTGSHFTDDGAVPQVFFGSTQATVVQATGTRITATVPAGSGRQPITVRRPFTGGIAYSLGQDFTYRPILTGFNPTIAVRGGRLEIQGQNFSPEGDNQVYIGGVLATPVSATATRLVVKVNPKSFTGSIQVFSYRAPSASVPLKVTSNLAPINLLLE